MKWHIFYGLNRKIEQQDLGHTILNCPEKDLQERVFNFFEDEGILHDEIIFYIVKDKNLTACSLKNTININGI